MEQIWNELYLAAKAKQNERQISDYVSCGEVSAALVTDKGNIYTGICVDSACSLGICAERNAIFNMLTNGENKISKLLAILPDGTLGSPCGACREFMVQLMSEDYQDIEIMLDFEKEEIVKLVDLTPKWWI